MLRASMIEVIRVRIGEILLPRMILELPMSNVRNFPVSSLCMFAMFFGIHVSAHAQLDTDLSPQKFAGSPSSVRIDSSQEGKTSLFRIYTFDAKGNISKVEQGSDRMGTTWVVDYLTNDAGEAISSSAIFMGNPTVKKTYSYDEKGRPTGFKVFQIRSGDEIESFVIEYDEKGRPFREKKQLRNRPQEILQRTFDENDQPETEVVMIDDRIVRTRKMTYNENNCLVKRVMSLPSGREDWSLWACDAECHPVKLNHTNSMGVLIVTSYAYDNHGNILRESKTRPNSEGDVPIELTWKYVYPEKKKDQPKAEEKKPD